MFKNIRWRQVHLILMLPLLAIIALLLHSRVWLLYPVETHFLLELSCIVMGGMIFVLLWFSYDRVPESYRLLGFSYLVISLLYALHTFSYADYSAALEDLSLHLVMTGRLIEALAFLAIALNIPLRLNKAIALFITLIIGGAITSIIIIFYPSLPVLFTTSGYTISKLGLEVVIMLILLISTYFLRINNPTRDLIAYNQIFAALLIDLLLTTFFLTQAQPNTILSIMGHLLRTTFYLHLFYGLFKSSISYPYSKLEEVLNHLPLAVVTYDHNQRLTCANSRAEEITGLNALEVKGLTHKQIIDKMFKQNSPEIIQEELTLGNEPRSTIVSIQNQQDERVKIAVDLYELNSGGFLLMFDTANKVLEIQNLRLQTQTILNSLNNFVVIIDVNNKIIMCNDAFCEQVEMKAQDIIGLSNSQLTQMISISGPAFVFNDLGRNIPENPQEVTIITPSGKSKDCLIQLAVIKNLDDELIGSICVGSDITNLKKEQAEIQQQEKSVLLGQMATGIVHEIRNPITAMMGFIQILNVKLKDDNLQEYCQYIEKEALELNKIVSHFFQFARPLPPILKPVSINSIVEPLKPMFHTKLFPLGIKIYYDLQTDLPLINADENKIRQAILNILKNAIDALKGVENPEISINTSFMPSSQEAYLSITNNGMTINPEVIKKIGTPFFTTKTKGSGLGLSICKQIVSEHQGTMNITSNAAIGTTVELVFPILEEEKQTNLG